VGHFPFILRIREIAREVWVIERSPKDGDLDEIEADNLISNRA